MSKKHAEVNRNPEEHTQMCRNKSKKTAPEEATGLYKMIDICSHVIYDFPYEARRVDK
jgi:hypothetical protein